MQVKATSNFADGSHKQGDVFEIHDEDEAKRLIEVEAVVAVDGDEVVAADEDQPEVTDPAAPEAPANPDPLDLTPQGSDSNPETPPPAPVAPVTPPAPSTPVQIPVSQQPTEAEIDKTLASLNEPPAGPSAPSAQ